VLISHPILYQVSDISVGSGKVRIHQALETPTVYEAFPLASFEYDFGALDRLNNPITNTYLNLVYVFVLRGSSCVLADAG